MLRRTALIAAALPICALAAMHAAAVFIVNMPGNPIKDAAMPFLRAYDGPQLQQGWEMFAPNPPMANLHVLVRGKHLDGTMTKWYDVTLFFLDAVAYNKAAPIREVDQSLLHAAFELEIRPTDDASENVVLRTTTAVLRLYESGPLSRVQVQLEDRPIEKVRGTAGARVTRLPWHATPEIGALR